MINPSTGAVMSWRAGVVHCLVLLLAHSLSAGLAPEETAVVINAESWLSRTLANEYATLRGIPAANLIHLEGITSHEGIPVDEFRERILQPVLVNLDRRRLAGHVSCVVYSADFPTWVDLTPDLGGRSLPPVVGNRASLTGLTCHYQGVMARQLDYLDLDSNWYARRPLQELMPVRPWRPEDQEAYREVMGFFAEKRRRDGQADADPAEKAAWERAEWIKAQERLEKVAAARPEQAEVVYNLACARARNGHDDAAMAALTAAVAAGFTDYRHILQDEDLTRLRSRDDFKALIERLRQWQPEMTPPVGFAASVGWTPQGTPTAPYKGARYLLSTMLGVCSGRGNAYGEVLAGLRRSAAADGSRPAGPVFFMLNDDVRSTAREWAVLGAAAMVRSQGVAAEVGRGVLPQGRADVAGLMVGAASFDWPASRSALLPGAIAEHLTSFGGRFDDGAGQTPLTEFIRHGAAGAAGTVAEPHAIQAKFPTAFLQAYYTAGYTLAEAFYLSISAPYQLLVVGDALCAPWAQPPTLRLQGIADGQRIDGAASLRVTPEPADAPLAAVNWFLDGQRLAELPVAATLEIDAARLLRGWHTLSAVAIGAQAQQTRARTTVRFLARGAPEEFDLIAVTPATATWDSMITITRRGAAEDRLALLWLGADVAVLEPGETEVKIRADQLALGRVELQPLLGFSPETAAYGTAVAVTITPTALPTAMPAGLLAALPAGLAVTVDGKVTYAQRADGDWLEKAGVRDGVPVGIEAVFEVAEAGVGQFQLQGNLPLDSNAFRVDGKALNVPSGSGWRALPADLAAGMHTLSITTTGRDHPRLDLRFGIRGTAILEGKAFRHR